MLDGEDRVSNQPVTRPCTAPSRSRAGLGALVRRMPQDLGLRREAEMMGIYVSLTLLAVLLTGNDLDGHTKLDVLWLVWGTTIGLAIAHWFALVLSVRLVRDPHVHHTSMEMLLSQVADGGVAGAHCDVRGARPAGAARSAGCPADGGMVHRVDRVRREPGRRTLDAPCRRRRSVRARSCVFDRNRRVAPQLLISRPHCPRADPPRQSALSIGAGRATRWATVDCR